MENKDLSRCFETIADLLEIQGENEFRIRSYRRAAQTIDRHPEPLARAAREGRLEEIPGIGKAIAEKIAELLETGELQFLIELQSKFPDGLLELLEIPGLGPKKVKLLWEQLGITNIPALQAACHEGNVRDLPGMGEKTESKILKGIEKLEERRHIFLLGDVREWAEELITKLQALPGVERVAYAGSARRGKETVGDLDILAAAKDAEPLMEWFRQMPDVQEVLAGGPTKTSLIWHDGIQVDLRVVPKESFGAALQYFTGSKEHNVRLREMAVAKGYKINEYGIFDAKTDKRLGGEEEDDIYKRLGLATPPPELREGSGELEAALHDDLPDLIPFGAIRGDLHVHSTWSDGRNTIEEMAAAAKERGYEYLAITDHSQSLQIANGLSDKRILEQIETIKKLNTKQKGFRILSGTEVDIASDGSLDFPDEILEQLDVVVASIHVGLSDDRVKQTKRTIAACENPNVHIIGHLTSRMLGRRDPFSLDTEAIFKAAVDTGTAIEINASPYRLDLCDRHVREAQSYGVKIVINTDAHAIDQLDYMPLGILTARRGWLGLDGVLNAQPVKKLLSFFQKKKKR